MLPETVRVKVWGDFALFTRPEFKVERVSYPFMTPSAARGVLDAILFKPQMRWHVRRITALKPWWISGDANRPNYRFISFLRNEVQDKISEREMVKGSNGENIQPFLVDSAGREGSQGERRTQRNSLVLQDVAYIIDASPILTSKANNARKKPEDVDEPKGPDSVAKYVAMFNRRVEKGQAFHHPYLGIREFACHFAPVDGSEEILSTWNEELGVMLYDMIFGEKTNSPQFFRAKVLGGVLHCDTQASGPNSLPPVRLTGNAPVEVVQ
jgi:CRISPR-associated protein Cas5d